MKPFGDKTLPLIVISLDNEHSGEFILRFQRASEASLTMERQNNLSPPLAQ